MNARLLLLCPGQGGQHEGMNAMARSDPAAAAFLDTVVLPPGPLFDNRVAQPSVVAATLAMWLALQPRLTAMRLSPHLVAGYSIGELAAAGVAGVFAPAATVELAQARARLMDQAAAAQVQTLAALGALPVESAAALLAAHGWALAIINGHDSVVAGGPADALPALQAEVALAGGRLQLLPVTVAAHTPLLATAVAPFAALLGATPHAPPRYPVLAGVSGAVAAPADLDALLSRQLAEPIRWADCMDAALESGITVALELGPGAALARMLQARHPRIACRSVAEFRSIDGVMTWLGRQAGRD
jgi:[acyl-carrier-protein] S-malonyltransferase